MMKFNMSLPSMSSMPSMPSVPTSISSKISTNKISDMKLFQRSLTDIIKGIRSHPSDTHKYISMVMKEIKDELRSSDMSSKAVALQKLTYLHSLGYDMSWASFHVIEVMSSPKFSHKRIGYLAASQSFDETTDVALLATNLFKKDFNLSSPFEVGLAISCLSNIATPDLCHDLVSDLVSKLGSSSPYVRKKACLCLYKVFLKYPDALVPSFPRLKAKLTDDEPSVVSAAVNVICELARKNPRNYLGLAPVLYNILTTSSNNWMVIKVVKLFGALLPLEPRLAKKLKEPLANLISNTQAKSLLYECIHTVTIGMGEETSVVQLGAEKLRSFIEDPDQNLKFLGLVLVQKLMVDHPRLVVEHRDIIMKCLTDPDITIREQAVRVVTGMATRRSIESIAQQLCEHASAAEPGYRDFLIEHILAMCGDDNYSRIGNFEWYIDLLVQLSTMQSVVNSPLIASQLKDVAIRVKAIRRHTVLCCTTLLGDARLMINSTSEKNCCEVLASCAYIVGEFCSLIAEIENKSDDLSIKFKQIAELLLDQRIGQLPYYVQRVYIHNAMKIYANAYTVFGEDEEDWKSFDEYVSQQIVFHCNSLDSEVQERACFFKSFLDLKEESSTNVVSQITTDLLDPSNNNNNDNENNNTVKVTNNSTKIQDLLNLFDEELLPISSKAQKKLQPKFDISEWIFDKPPQIKVEELKAEAYHGSAATEEFWNDQSLGEGKNESNQTYQSPQSRPASASLSQGVKPENRVFYLQDDQPNSEENSSVAHLILPEGEDRPGHHKKGKRHHKSKKHEKDEEKSRPEVLIIGAQEVSEDDEDSDGDDIAKKLNVGDLTKIKSDAKLPEIQSYVQYTASSISKSTSTTTSKDNEKSLSKDKKEEKEERKHKKHDKHDKHDKSGEKESKKKSSSSSKSHSKKEEKEKEEKKESLWRISSTLFSHIASDQVLQPIGKFAQESTASLYPPTYAGDYVNEELKAIKLSANS
eukprot:c21149_g1_i1.p1 GENE.c21149_g1_i1~~c21149_g1_i1.p1  ORF type:complete len:979 (+),score=402.45 c21149_g1_i1:59-2995(+)